MSNEAIADELHRVRADDLVKELQNPTSKASSRHPSVSSEDASTKQSVASDVPSSVGQGKLAIGRAVMDNGRPPSKANVSLQEDLQLQLAKQREEQQMAISLLRRDLETQRAAIEKLERRSETGSLTASAMQELRQELDSQRMQMVELSNKLNTNSRGFAKRLGKLEDSTQSSLRTSRGDDLVQLVEVLMMRSKWNLEDFISKTDGRLARLEKILPNTSLDLESSIEGMGSGNTVTESAEALEMERPLTRAGSLDVEANPEMKDDEILNMSWMSDNLKQQLTGLDLTPSKARITANNADAANIAGSNADGGSPTPPQPSTSRAGAKHAAPVIHSMPLPVKGKSDPTSVNPRAQSQLVTSTVIDREQSPLLHSTLDVPRSPRPHWDPSSVSIHTSTVLNERQHLPFGWSTSPTRTSTDMQVDHMVSSRQTVEVHTSVESSTSVQRTSVETRTSLDRHVPGAPGSSLETRSALSPRTHSPNIVQSPRLLVNAGAGPPATASGPNTVKSSQEMLRPASPAGFVNGSSAAQAANNVPVSSPSGSGSFPVGSRSGPGLIGNSANQVVNVSSARSADRAAQAAPPAVVKKRLPLRAPIQVPQAVQSDRRASEPRIRIQSVSLPMGSSTPQPRSAGSSLVVDRDESGQVHSNRGTPRQRYADTDPTRGAHSMI